MKEPHASPHAGISPNFISFIKISGKPSPQSLEASPTICKAWKLHPLHAKLGSFTHYARCTSVVGERYGFVGDSIHLIDVIEQEVLYANVENASFIVPADDVVSHDHNLHERVVDFRERVCFLLPLALFRYRQC